MADKVVVIIATKEKEKAITGMMYAKNAAKNKWLKDVKVVFFGPAEKLIAEDEEAGAYAADIAQLTETYACKYLSDRDNISDKIRKQNIKIENVGTIISDYVKDGYETMVW